MSNIFCLPLCFMLVHRQRDRCRLKLTALSSLCWNMSSLVYFSREVSWRWTSEFRILAICMPLRHLEHCRKNCSVASVQTTCEAPGNLLGDHDPSFEKHYEIRIWAKNEERFASSCDSNLSLNSDLLEMLSSCNWIPFKKFCLNHCFPFHTKVR